MANYKRSFSAGVKKTSVGNDTITFIDPDGYNANTQFLHFQTFTSPCSIKLNDESTIHWIDSNSEFIISDIYIGKITVIDAGIQYYYTALAID